MKWDFSFFFLSNERNSNWIYLIEKVGKTRKEFLSNEFIDQNWKWERREPDAIDIKVISNSQDLDQQLEIYYRKRNNSVSCKCKGGMKKNSKFYWIESKIVIRWRWNQCLKCDRILLRRCELSISLSPSLGLLSSIELNHFVQRFFFFTFEIVMRLQPKSALNSMMENEFRWTHTIWWMKQWTWNQMI